MKRNIIKILIVSVLIFLQSNANPVHAQDRKTKIYVAELKQEIARPAWLRIQKAMGEIRAGQYDILLIHMNTYGGVLDAADSIRTALLQCKIPVWVFVDNNAASAGALIAIACDSIFMRPGASIGAATVVNQSGEKMPDKYQSYMRSMMRSTAEANGRDPDIAQAMVDPGGSLPGGLTDSGRVLTLTSAEAMKWGYCEGVANTVEEVISKAGVKDYAITRLKLTAMDRLIGFLVNPIVSGILIMIIIGGIYFEFQSPGATFPIAAAGLAALLYFAPLYLEGLAEHWEILVFLAGVGLLAVEIFAIPGFGVAGITGIAMMMTGLTLSLLGNLGLDFTGVGLSAAITSLFMVIIAVFFSALLSIYLSKKLFASQMFGGLALDTVQKSSEGYNIADESYRQWVGQEGIAATVLRPGGKVEIKEDIYDALADSGFIEKGEKVKVVGYEKAQLLVRKLGRE